MDKLKKLLVHFMLEFVVKFIDELKLKTCCVCGWILDEFFMVEFMAKFMEKLKLKMV